jgi:galactokinase
MDQLASALGQRDHAVLLDCASLQTTAVPIPSGAAVLVIDSRIQRGLVESEYNLRRQQCEAAAMYFGVATLRDVGVSRWQVESSRMDPILARRAKHVVTENARTLQAARCLEEGDLHGLGELLAQSHASLRDDFEVSLPPIDALVDLVQGVAGSHGGARMTGGGFGGCVVALVPNDRVDAIEQAVARHYRSPSGQPGVVHRCRASDGADVVR